MKSYFLFVAFGLAIQAARRHAPSRSPAGGVSAARRAGARALSVVAQLAHEARDDEAIEAEAPGAREDERDAGQEVKDSQLLKVEIRLGHDHADDDGEVESQHEGRSARQQAENEAE